MRLEHRRYPSLGHYPCGIYRGGDLVGMMGVIGIDVRPLRQFALELEAPPDAAKTAYRAARFRRVAAHRFRSGDRGERVQDIVFAAHFQRAPADDFYVRNDVKRIKTVLVSDVARAVIALRRIPERLYRDASAGERGGFRPLCDQRPAPL